MIAKLKTLTQHQGFWRYFANTSWLMGEKILRMGVGLFVGIWVARYLGPEQFGLLSYAQSFVFLFTAIATLGLDRIVVCELVKAPEKRNELLGTAFWLKIIGTIIMIGAILICVQFTSNDNFTNLLIVIIATSFIFQAFNVIDFNFQATVQSKYIVHVQIIQMFISSIAKLTLIWLSAPLLWFAFVSLVDSVVLAIGFVWKYLRKVDKISLWKPKIETAISLLKDSWPLILSSVALALYTKIDQTMIKLMVGDKELGYYTIAVNLCEAWYFIPMAITGSLFPSIIKAKKASEELYYLRLQDLYNLLAWIAIVIALSVTFLAPQIINFLFGIEYFPASSVLRIYIWSGVFVFLSVISGYYLINENYTKIAFCRTAICAAVNILLNIFLIPRYGINGAAVATVISYSFLNIIVMLFPKTYRNSILMLRSLLLIGFLRKLFSRNTVMN